MHPERGADIALFTNLALMTGATMFVAFAWIFHIIEHARGGEEAWYLMQEILEGAGYGQHDLVPPGLLDFDEMECLEGLTEDQLGHIDGGGRTNDQAKKVKDGGQNLVGLGRQMVVDETRVHKVFTEVLRYLWRCHVGDKASWIILMPVILVLFDFS